MCKPPRKQVFEEWPHPDPILEHKWVVACYCEHCPDHPKKELFREYDWEGCVVYCDPSCPVKDLYYKDYPRWIVSEPPDSK